MAVVSRRVISDLMVNGVDTYLVYLEEVMGVPTEAAKSHIDILQDLVPPLCKKSHQIGII